jgi:hypothetical protein
MSLSAIKRSEAAYDSIGYASQLEAIVEVARFHGKVWDIVHTQVERGEISADFWATAIEQLCEDVKRHRLRSKVEQTLLEIRKHQGGTV